MKLDVEEAEAEVLFDLIHSGAMQHLDNIHVDWHTSFVVHDDKSSFDMVGVILPKDDDITSFLMETLPKLYKMKAVKYQYGRLTEIQALDDESFNDFNGELPVC